MQELIVTEPHGENIWKHIANSLSEVDLNSFPRHPQTGWTKLAAPYLIDLAGRKQEPALTVLKEINQMRIAVPVRLRTLPTSRTPDQERQHQDGLCPYELTLTLVVPDDQQKQVRSTLDRYAVHLPPHKASNWSGTNHPPVIGKALAEADMLPGGPHTMLLNVGKAIHDLYGRANIQEVIFSITRSRESRRTKLKADIGQPGPQGR